MLFLALLAVGCQTQDLVISHDYDGCLDYDPNDPPVEQLVVEEGDLSVTVYHDGVFAPSDSIFDPEISLDRKTIEVREYWTEGTEGDTCWTPAITLKDPPHGKYDVFWYIGDEAAPWQNIELKVD